MKLATRPGTTKARRYGAPAGINLLNDARRLAHINTAAQRWGAARGIEDLANATNDLAKQAGDGSVQYQDFEEILGLLHAGGFFDRDKGEGGAHVAPP
ncbi:MAG: hypothetical protein WDN46_11340 [Methylocella sp.]